jgi:hypothetical protein
MPSTSIIIGGLWTTAAAGASLVGAGDIMETSPQYRRPICYRGGMALLATRRNLGMLLLAIYLILVGIAGIVPLGLPSPIMPVLALLAGVLILLGR